MRGAALKFQIQLKGLNSISKRLLHSAVVWSWMFNVLRLAAGLLLLPLVLHKLTQSDLGMYYVFLGLTGLLPTIDVAFSFNIGRYVGYAMAGAQRLQPQGIDYSRTDVGPNYKLLWELLIGTQALYRLLALGVILILGVAGTAVVGLRIDETSSPPRTWIAWTITLVAAAWEIYSGWWSVFLQGMNQVVLSTRLSSVAYAAKVLIAAVLLFLGAGLLALPLAGLVSGLWLRSQARRRCLALLSVSAPPAAGFTLGSLLNIIWPNSWRAGLKLLSLYSSTATLAFLCLKYLGLKANAQYGLSLQIMSIIQGISSVWTAVKWPLIGQLRARQDLGRLRRELWPRLWLQRISFFLLAAVVLALGPRMISLIDADKQLVPIELLFAMALNAFLDMQFGAWATFISTENRIPTLWPTVISSVVTIGLVWMAIASGWSGIGALVLGPLIVGCLFNYWFWGCEGARTLKTTWWRFVFVRPRSAAPVTAPGVGNR